MGQKERTLEEIAAELADYFIDAVGDKVEKMIISERLLREKVEGELEQTKSDARIIIDTSMAFQDEITKLKSELENLECRNSHLVDVNKMLKSELEEAKKNTSSNGEIFDCNILEATDTFGTCCSYHRAEKLNKENLSLSIQVNKLRSILEYISFNCCDCHKSEKGRACEDWCVSYKAKEALSESPSPKDIGKVVREVAEVLDEISIECLEKYKFKSWEKAQEARTKLREIL